MATYAELAEFLKVSDNSGLRQKVAVAALVRADAVRQEVDDGTAAVRHRKRYAQQIAESRANSAFLGREDDGYSTTEIERIYRFVIIANASATVAQIAGASDAQIQTAVDAAFDFVAARFPEPVV